MPDVASGEVGRTIPSTSSKETLLLLGHIINFIDNWPQCFEFNDQNRIMIYKRKMNESFKLFRKSLPPKTPDDY